MKVAVIGATGILGRALLPLLKRSGHDIHALAPDTKKSRSLFGVSAESFACDLLSPHAEQQLLDGIGGCHAVIHIATAIPRDFSRADAWQANSLIRTRGVQLAVNSSIRLGVQRYLQQSVIMAYPDCGDRWIYESNPLDNSPERAEICAPVITMEKTLRDTPVDLLHWSVLRGGEFIGPGTLQEVTIESMKQGGLVIPGDGRRFMSVVHVEDMAAAFVLALEKAPPASFFNIVDDPVQQGTYLEQLADYLAVPRPPYDNNASLLPSWRCSSHAARSVLNWTAQKSIFP